MKATLFSCPMCGRRFDPADHVSCQSCPLQNGCRLVRCPTCGYETIDTSQSKLSRLASRMLPRIIKSTPSAPELTLADVPPGCRAKVTSFSQAIPTDRQAHLQAYGLVPGYWVLVLQHSPVTVVQVEHTELALETELACEIRVEEMRYQ